ncbi:17649_t:CDS:2, partial [Acaulospora morrowiae]
MDSHRSVIIQSIQKTANATADPNQLWTFVTSRSGIIASNAIKQIIDLVKSEVVPWSQALDGFLNVLSTVSGVTLDDVIIGITDILSFHAEREIDSTLDYNCPFSVKAAHGGKTHPYITIISTNPDETCTILFSQLQRIFGSIGSTSQRNSKYLQNVMMMMNPFFDFVLLDGESTQNSWFLRLLNFIVNLTYRNVNDEFFQIFRERVLDYLLSVTQKIMQTSDSNISSKYTIISNSIYPILQSLVDILQAPFVRNSLSSSFLREFSINLSIQILSVSTDAHHSNLSTISYVSLLSNLLELHQDFPDVISKPSFVILWPSLSFLLLDAQSCEVQTKTLEIMKKLTENREDAINERDISPALINIAVLPIFQAISELQGTSRANVMDILFAVRRFSMIQKVINESSRDKISALLESQNISGTIIDILSETRLLLENFSEESNLENSFLKSNSYLTKLFHVPYFFHHDVKTRIHALNRVISVIGENSESHKFPIFLIFLYILRNDDSSSIHIHILYRSLPSLVSANDFAISSKILKISMSLIEGEDGFRETKLCAVGIRMLHKLCIRYKGCWKSLRFVLAEWVKKRKLVTISKFDKMYTAGEGFEVELAALATMRCELLRDMCRSNGKDYAEELLPFISSLLQSVILHPKSLCLIIESLTACVEAEVANARAGDISPEFVWSVLLVHVAKAITRREDFNAQLISRLCDFYKSIAQSDESTDVYSEFKKEILSSYICPLVFPRRFDATEEEGQNVLFQIQRDRRILRLGLQTISYFPAVDILSWILLESPEALLSQIFHEDAEGGSDLCQIEEWQYVFGKIISHEI